MDTTVSDAEVHAETGADGQSAQAPIPQAKLRGFNIGRYRVSHMRTRAADGFAHELGEGRFAVTLFALESMVEAGGRYHAGWRLTCGHHMLTLFRR